MARGRMIANAITNDKRVNDLSSDTSRLAFTWLVTYADCEGRTYGDPALVRSMLFPRRDDVTTAQVTGFIEEWVRLGLVIWYEAEGDRWIYFPAFAKNQPGLRKDHEQASTIPAPPVAQDASATAPLRSDDVVTTAQVKLSEVNVSEVNAAAPAAQQHLSEGQKAIGAVYQSWEDLNPRRQVTPMDADKLSVMIDEYGPPRVLEAIRAANDHGKPYLAYIDACLRNKGSPPDPPPKPKPSGPVVILNPVTGKREVIGGNGNTTGCETTAPG